MTLLARYTRRVPRRGLAALSLLLFAAACSTPVKEPVFEEPPVSVFLRSWKSWQFGSLVEKDYSHPITISPVRIAHILSRIDVRLAGKREPADAHVHAETSACVAKLASHAIASR